MVAATRRAAALVDRYQGAAEGAGDCLVEVVGVLRIVEDEAAGQDALPQTVVQAKAGSLVEDGVPDWSSCSHLNLIPGRPALGQASLMVSLVVAVSVVAGL